MMGLSAVSASASFDTIAYTIYARSDGGIMVYENGVLVGSYGAYQSGDVLRVERIDTSVEYKQNGVVFYTSAVPSTSHLVADVSIYYLGGRIDDAIVFGAFKDFD